ncbi:MAG: S41 family peptidase [Muribaculaceae bacterium]|nr:S41 family peptidase [Muribaculaceae bacterium]MBQ6648855.1 S41 family peptidase [Muribaculaceae bacterium]
MKKFAFTFALMLALTGVASAQFLNNNASLRKLLNAHYAISNFYVDTLSEDRLIEEGIKGMLESLDPHSTYTNAKETKELEEPLQGEFSGIGIQFNMKQDTLYVIQTTVGGPSEKVGIMAGDRIITVNDTTIAGVKMKNSDIMKRLRGKKGSKVTVQVKRGNNPELITFRITRDKIPLYSIDATYMIDEKTGYVLISRFGAKTYDEMVEAIKKLEKQGMKQVIIDLGNNGGGYLNAAIDMCNEFLQRGQLIVYTQGDKNPRKEAKANGLGDYKDLKMVVIVDQLSASASEIFAGAMQDWDRAVVVGRRSYGKGLVQSPFKFDDGSMMRLTVARYYTPSGRCIQKPYTKGDKKHYEEDLLDRSKEGEYYHLDSIQFNDSLSYKTLKNGRTIYGGGGIMPDVFVPLDTTENSKYYRDMLAKGIINQFAVDYVDKHRAGIKSSYKDVHDFDKRFSLTDADLKAFIAMGEKDSVKYNEKDYKTSERLFKTVLKGLIARDVFADPGAYTIIINHRNTDVQEALRVINDDKLFNSLLTRGNPDYDRLAREHKEKKGKK